MQFLVVLLIALAAAAAAPVKKRGVFSLGYADPYTTYSYALPPLSYASFLASFNTIPISNYLDVQLQPVSASGVAEKPVTEPALEPPAPTGGASISVALPQTNAYSLGSGSLGAVQLTDGRLALGSGSLGYTQRSPSSGATVDLILEGFLQQTSQQPPSYFNDRRPQNFGLGALPNLPQTTNPPPPPETRGYASTPGLSSARS